MLFKPCLQCALKRHLAAVLQGERQPPQRLEIGRAGQLAAASVLFGELRSRLFACAISCPKLVVLQALAAIKTFAAVVAFVALLATAPPFFLTCFEPQKTKFQRS